MTYLSILNVAVIGAGTMGAHIAFRSAAFGKETRIFDVSPEALRRAVAAFPEWLAQVVVDGRLATDVAQSAPARLHPSTSLTDCVGRADLVVEAVPEKLELKRQVFSQVDCLAPAHALLATASSSIPCSRIAEATDRPDKVLNLHFYQSRPLQPPEIMPGPETSAETIAAAERFVYSLGLFPIIVKREIMGFGMNTLWHEIKRTALHLVAGGYLDFEDIDRSWILGYGQRRGLFAAMDVVGLDVVRDIELQYYQESGDARDRPPRFLDDLIAQGRLGVKSGRGFYTYPNPEYERPGWLYKQPPWRPEMTIKL